MDTTPARATARLIADWRHFIRGGFRLADLTEGLFEHLQSCYDLEDDGPYEDREAFWTTWIGNLYNFKTFLTEMYEVEAHDAIHAALQAELGPLYWRFKEVLDEFEWETYVDIRESEIAAYTEQEAARQPERDRAEIECELREYFDQCMTDWFYTDYFLDIDLDEEVFEALAAVAPDEAAPAWQPSVFDLKAWLDQRRSLDGPVAQQPQSQVAQVTLFTASAAGQVDREADEHETTRTVQATLFEQTSLPAAAADPDMVSFDEDRVSDRRITDDADAETKHRNLEAIKRRLSASPEEESEMKRAPQLKQSVLANEMTYRLSS